MELLDSCDICVDLYKKLIIWYSLPEMRHKTNLNVKKRKLYKQILIQICTDNDGVCIIVNNLERQQ